MVIKISTTKDKVIKHEFPNKDFIEYYFEPSVFLKVLFFELNDKEKELLIQEIKNND